MSSKEPAQSAADKIRLGLPVEFPQTTREEHEAMLARLEALAEGQDGTLAAYEVETTSDEAFLPLALTAQWGSRGAARRDAEELMPPYGWRLLLHVPAADFALSGLDGGWIESQLSPGDDPWSTHLREALDDFCDILWMLRRGLTLAAVVKCRYFLERWTFNVESSHKLDPLQPGEAPSDYMSRIWSHYGSLPGGRNPGEDWVWLSELLHGREVRAPANSSFPVLVNATGVGKLRIHNQVARIAEVPFRQVLGSIELHARSQGDDSYEMILTKRPSNRPPFEEIPIIRNSLGPMDVFFATSDRGRALAAMAEDWRAHMTHRDQVDHFATTLVPVEAQLALIERVGRKVENALLSYEHEIVMVGDAEFEPAALGARLFRYGAIADAAKLLAREMPGGPAATALDVAGDALESASQFWLEDSDSSVACVRTLVEQTARARVHRLKPTKASYLESRGALSSPTRWIEAAGWSRLSAYTRALGEFSHVTRKSKVHGARQLLADIQKQPDAVTAAHLARGDALENGAYLLAQEIATCLGVGHPALAAAFRSTVTLMTEAEHEKNLNEWLDRVLARRGTDFGKADLEAAAASLIDTGVRTTDGADPELDEGETTAE